MQPLSDTISSTDLLLNWHVNVQFIAYGLLAALGLFALWQFAAANPKSAFANTLLPNRSLRSQLIYGLTLVGTIPVLALILVLTERSAQMRLERLSNRLSETARTTAFSVEQFLDKHIAGVETIASLLSAGGDFSRESAVEQFLLHHAVYEDFASMFMTDASGNIIAATNYLADPMRLVEDPRANELSIADRDHFTATMSTGKTVVSDPYDARGPRSGPKVAICSPLFDAAGNIAGLVAGGLDLLAFAAIDRERPSIDGATMIVLDEHDHVIYATEGSQLAALGSMEESSMLSAAEPHDELITYNFQQMLDNEEVRHIGIYAETATGWRVFLHAPLRGVIAELSSDYRLGGLLLVVACAIALLFARAIVRRVSVSVRDMHAAVDSLSVDGGSEVVQVPANTLAEFLPFFDAMGKKSGDLKKAYSRLKNSTQAGEALRRELTQRITLNEVEIAERTEELEEAYASLRSLSKTDALTGIANRRGFDEFEQRAYRHAARKMLPISVILVDIDYFKIYNDSLGHQAGDECLKTVAETLLSCANRPLDLVARYGGEEFVAVLGETEIKNALIVGERMRNRVEQLKIEHPGSSHYVLTVSVGIASVIPTHDSTAESLVKAADDALYYAKAAGRNCVVFREDEKYVTYDGEDFDRGSTTSVLHILKNKPA